MLCLLVAYAIIATDITRDSGGEKSLNHATEGINLFPNVYVEH